MRSTLENPGTFSTRRSILPRYSLPIPRPSLPVTRPSSLRHFVAPSLHLGSLGVETFETFIAEAIAFRAGFQEVSRFLWPVPDGPPVPAVAFRKTRPGNDASTSVASGVGGKQQHPGGVR